METLATAGEVLAALSHALDLVEGQPRGHAVRTAMIAMRIGKELGLSDHGLENLFYAALIKDAGCSTNSARIHKIFGGDEFLTKMKVKLVDWSKPVEAVKYAIGAIDPNAGVIEKLRRMAAMAGSPGNAMDEATNARCTRGAAIAIELGFNLEVAAAIRALDEHWDGKGSPNHEAGEDIEVLARILCLSQTIEVFLASFDLGCAREMVSARSGRWFDPEICRIIESIADTDSMWQDHARQLAGESVPLPEPESGLEHPLTDIDRISTAFASIIDAKSTFTGEHSTRVTTYSIALGEFFELNEDRLVVLRRAALLHDIGKLGVPNSILDKPAKLTDDEFERIKQHPRFTHEILSQIRGQERMTEIAANHHERLDGTGYWRGISADALDLEMRILAAADVFDALTAKRPYREALPLDTVFSIMGKDAGRHLDESCVSALSEIYQQEDFMAA